MIGFAGFGGEAAGDLVIGDGGGKAEEGAEHGIAGNTITGEVAQIGIVDDASNLMVGIVIFIEDKFDEYVGNIVVIEVYLEKVTAIFKMIIKSIRFLFVKAPEGETTIILNMKS